jgi:hypothetical protein
LTEPEGSGCVSLASSTIMCRRLDQRSCIKGLRARPASIILYGDTSP